MFQCCNFDLQEEDTKESAAPGIEQMPEPSEATETLGYACFTVPMEQASHPARPPQRLEVSVSD